MKHNLSTSLLSSVFVAGMIVAGSVSAQQMTQPLPAGNSATGTMETPKVGAESRGMVKAETKAAAKSGGTVPAGNSVTPGVSEGPTKVMSGKSRESVKSETRAALRTPNGTLPAGNSENMVPAAQTPPGNKKPQ